MAWLTKIMPILAIVLDALQTIMNELSGNHTTTNTNSHLATLRLNNKPK